VRQAFATIDTLEQRREAGPALVELVRSEWTSVRRRAVEALGRIGEPVTFALLRGATRDDDASVRLAAIQSIGIAGDEGATAVLVIRAALEADERLRAAALDSLGRVGGDGGFPAMEVALEQRSAALRERAAVAVAMMGYRGKVVPVRFAERLSPLLRDPSPRVRWAAVYAWWQGRLCEGTVSSPPPWFSQLRVLARTDPSEEVRGAAVRALGTCSGAGPDGLSAPAMDVVAAALGDPSLRVAVQAARALASLGDPGIERLAVAVHTDLASRLRRGGEESMVPLIVAALELLVTKTERPAVQEALKALAMVTAPSPPAGSRGAGVQRIWCASVLALDTVAEQVGPPGGVLNVPAGELRWADLCNELAAPAVAPWRRRSWRVRSLLAGRSSVVERRHELLAMLSDPDVRVRAVVITALGQLLTEVAAQERGPAPSRGRGAGRSALPAGGAADELERALAPALEAGLASEDPAMVVAAATTVGKLQPTGEVALRAGGWLIGRLDALLAPDARALQTEAILAVTDALKQLRTTAATPLLRRLLAHPHQLLRRRGREAYAWINGLDPPPVSIQPSAVARALPGRSASSGEIAVVHTVRGTFRIQLEPQRAPRTVAHFVELTRRGFYNGLTFHRVVTAMLAQGGDPRGDGFGQSGQPVACELSSAHFERGSVAMALAGKDTARSQLFITLTPSPQLDGRYTHFGHITEGVEVLDRLVEDDRIERVTIQ
jgi:cyclophilin family peptidyl-prolyl cis-trans isomerase/HEAT repeat protein